MRKSKKIGVKIGSLLMNAYKRVASGQGVNVAQMLVTVDDMEDRRCFLNIKNTVLRLF